MPPKTPLRGNLFQTGIRHAEHKQCRHYSPAILAEHFSHGYLPVRIQEQIARYHQEDGNTPADQIQKYQKHRLLHGVIPHIRMVHDSGDRVQQNYRTGCRHSQFIQKHCPFFHIRALPSSLRIHVTCERFRRVVQKAAYNRSSSSIVRNECAHEYIISVCGRQCKFYIKI